MILNVLERLVLVNILPREGAVTTVRIVRELREALSFSEEEHAALQFEQLPGGSTKWNVEAEDAAGPKDVQIGPRAFTVIAETLEKFNAEEKLTEDLLSVYDKFVTNPPAAAANDDSTEPVSIRDDVPVE